MTEERPDRLGRIRYSWWAMLSDWYNGLRDGWRRIPARTMAEPVTTPHRESLIRLAEEVFERERIRYEADRADAHTRAEAATARLAALHRELSAATARLAEIGVPLSVPEQLRRRAGDRRHGDEVVVQRRRAEFRHTVDSAWADVERLQAEITGVEAGLSAATAEEEQCLRVATARTVRVYQHIQLRMAAYLRQLVRLHEHGGWAAERLLVPVHLPAWTKPALLDPDVLETEDADENEEEPWSDDAGGPQPEETGEQEETIPLPERVTPFGSAMDAPYRIDAPGTAPRHFAVIHEEDGLRLRDYGHGNGPYVNGHPVKSARLRAGDAFEYADRRYRVLDGCRELRSSPLTDIKLVLLDVTAKTPKSDKDPKALLSGASLVQRANTLMAVLGPSGAGKSSLFNALMGELRVEEGEIYFDHLDVARQPARIKDMLGFVPQQDDMHRTLTIRSLLGYAFDLRDPRGEPARGRAVDKVCEILDISPGQMDQPVATLSGGQRKRVSTALELLHRPALLMLDEPTSGLDAGLDLRLMRRLRAYAREGHTVVVITHATENLGVADQVLILAQRGRPLYCGPPGGALDALGVRSYAELMTLIARDEEQDPERHVERWARGYRAGPQHGRAAAAASEERRQAANGVRGSRIRRVRSIGVFWRQFRTLVRRQVRLLLPMGSGQQPTPAKRLYAWRSAATPFGIAAGGALLAALVVRGGAMGAKTADQMGIAVSLLSTLSVLSGLALTYSNLVSEFPVIKREHRTGTRVLPVMLSKFLVFTVIAILQAGAMTLVFCAFHAPTASVRLPARIELFADLAALGVASMSLGLLISAHARRLEHAVAAFTLASLTQIALNGYTSDLSDGGPLNWFSMLLPDRMGLAAIASSTDLTAITARVVPRDQLIVDGNWAHTAGAWQQDLLWLGVLTLVYLGLAAHGLSVRLRPAGGPRRPAKRPPPAGQEGETPTD
ncbi:ATP-binding cassette domain-containing protein [Actinomadura latina]|uniref:ATP-binding cassette domain-containing protein n=1 Tax=Actinomadura latina TaxID=163603 RepID=A0A846Z2A4_9ACTN|nr:ATP-binding cassette domain-containing protein [Actinomadura latina]NKZ05272.1 ATP-binding cassette domain-containing protein [Actinomadura latina]